MGPETMSAREALASLGEVSRRDDALKARVEGLTWVTWGFANAGLVLTSMALAPGDAARPPPWQASPLAVLFAFGWVVAGVLASVGLWRSAALSFRTGMTWRRGALFFLVWPLLTALLTFVAIPLVGWENGVLAKTMAIGLLLLGFAWLDPLGFTPRGRASALTLGFVGVFGAAGGLAFGVGAEEAMLLVAAVLGAAWVIVGLFAVFRG